MLSSYHDRKGHRKDQNNDVLQKFDDAYSHHPNNDHAYQGLECCWNVKNPKVKK